MPLLLVFACVLVGCARPSSPRALANAQPTPEALAEQVLDRLAQGDVAALTELRLTKGEFCEYVWPELPSSKFPNVECDWAWSQATLTSLAGMTKVLEGHKGRRYELVSVRFAGAPEQHESYRVLKDPSVTVRDSSGAVKEMRLFGSMLELDGQYKLFSYVVD